MGRPLYSSAFKSSPMVRDPEPPSYEKWSSLNAFDPDSDEFFDNENAVYEDFVGPVASANPEEEVEVDDEERELLVVRMGNASPITSESSLSDSDSSLAIDAEDPATLVVDTLHDGSQTDEAGSALMGATILSGVARRASATRVQEARWGSQTAGSGRSYSRRGFAAAATMRTVSYHPYPQRDESLPVPTPSAPIPVPAVSPRFADERSLSPPSTPPLQTPAAHLSISPPPTSTPRLYSWARNPGHTSSPSSGGPFTNPRARTSYAHLSPALIRIHDVTV